VLKIIKHLLYVRFAPVICAREVGDAGNKETINRQNVLSFSVTGVIRDYTSPRVGNPRVAVSASCTVAYTQGDSDVISSYHIYASCFPAILWGKLCGMFVILTSLS